MDFERPYNGKVPVEFEIYSKSLLTDEGVNFYYFITQFCDVEESNEKNFPTKQQEEEEQARLPRPDEDQSGTKGVKTPPRQGQSQTLRMISHD